MGKITKASVAWEGLLASLSREVNDWNPENFDKETEYRDSLAAHLRACAPDARIEKEYRHIGTTIDIYFEWQGFLDKDHVFIELKRNLTQKSQLDRLIGQTEGLEADKHKIIIVLCGKTDSALLDRLKAKYKRYTTDALVPSMRIIDKPSGARKAAG